MHSARELLRRGEELRWQHRLDEAELVFAEALEIARQEEGAVSEPSADAMIWLSVVRTLRSRDPSVLTCALEMEQTAMAIEVELHGEHSARAAETRRTIASTLLLLGRRDEALAYLEKSVDVVLELRLNSTSAREALVELADLSYALGRLEQSEAVARELIQLEAGANSTPRQKLLAVFFRARALLDLGRAVEAVQEFERVMALAISIDPGGRSRLSMEMAEWLAKARAAAIQPDP